jgi:hypothetical protein
VKRCALQRELDRTAAAAERAEQVAVDAARVKYVIPFCDRTGYRLSAGMGSWSFHRDTGPQWSHMLNYHDEKHIPARVYAVMTAETSNGQDAGSMMQDYTP